MAIAVSEQDLENMIVATSHSVNMNLMIPDGDDYIEIPIPHQFVHRVVNKAVVSEVSELYG